MDKKDKIYYIILVAVFIIGIIIYQTNSSLNGNVKQFNSTDDTNPQISEPIERLKTFNLFNLYKELVSEYNRIVEHNYKFGSSNEFDLNSILKSKGLYPQIDTFPREKIKLEGMFMIKTGPDNNLFAIVYDRNSNTYIANDWLTPTYYNDNWPIFYRGNQLIASQNSSTTNKQLYLGAYPYGILIEINMPESYTWHDFDERKMCFSNDARFYCNDKHQIELTIWGDSYVSHSSGRRNNFDNYEMLTLSIYLQYGSFELNFID